MTKAALRLRSEHFFILDGVKNRHPFSPFFLWVMERLAITVKVNQAGACPRHFLKVDFSGSL